MENYKPNSHKYKEENKALPEKKVTKIVNGKVKRKPKSGIGKLADNFISEDAANVKSYILMDVLIPAAKKAVADIVTNGIEMLLYGEVRGDRKKLSTSYVSYNKYYDRERDRERDRHSRYSRSGYYFEDIVLETRGEAEDVLTAMDELLDVYGVASVSDLCELVGSRSNYTDNKYGWTNLRTAEVIRVRDGYLLKLPKASPID